MCIETYGFEQSCCVYTQFKTFLHVTWPKAEGQNFDKLTQLCVALTAHKVKKKKKSFARRK